MSRQAMEHIEEMVIRKTKKKKILSSLQSYTVIITTEAFYEKKESYFECNSAGKDQSRI